MKKILLLIATVLCGVSTNAQISSSFSFNSSNQQLVEMAIEGAFVDIERSYRIKDLLSGQLFGLNGNDMFGSSHSLAIKTSQGIIVTEEAVKPWEYDKNYNKVREKYGTSLYKVRMITNGMSEFETDSISVSEYEKQPLLFCIQDSIVSDTTGLRVESGSEEMEGWLVWVSGTDNNIRDYSIIKYKWNVLEGNNIYEIESPTTSKKLLGGVFVSPKQVSCGMLAFCVSGVIVKSQTGWCLARITNPIKRESITQSEEYEQGVNITPIENQEDKKPKKSKKNK